MIVNCTASHDLRVKSVRHVSAGVAEDSKALFRGPVFEHLDYLLQDAFYAYLSDRNIDQELCFFMLSYSKQKEQSEYTNWLNQLLQFTEK